MSVRWMTRLMACELCFSKLSTKLYSEVQTSRGLYMHKKLQFAHNTVFQNIWSQAHYTVQYLILRWMESVGDLQGNSAVQVTVPCYVTVTLTVPCYVTVTLTVPCYVTVTLDFIFTFAHSIPLCYYNHTCIHCQYITSTQPVQFTGVLSYF
jgi:hypothetical protein